MGAAIISSSAKSAKPVTVLIVKFNDKSFTSIVNKSLNNFFKDSLSLIFTCDNDLGNIKLWSKRSFTLADVLLFNGLSVQALERVVNLLY